MRFGLFDHTHPEKESPGKYLSVKADGTLGKRTQGTYSRSLYRTVTVKSLADLVDWIRDEVLPTQHLSAGINEHDQAICLPDWVDASDCELPLMHRTNECLPFPDGEGLMLVDTDSETDDLTFEYVWNALIAACPMMAQTMAIQATSSSSNVVWTGRSVGISGLHTFFHVKEASDIPRALEVLHQRLILAGYHRHRSNKSGTVFLERSLADQQLRVPSQPIYLKAHVSGGVEQKKEVLLRPGMEVLDTKVSIPPLTPDEEAKLNQHLIEAKAILQPEMDRKKAAYREAKSDKLVEATGVSKESALATVDALLEHKFLWSNFIVYVGAAMEPITVREILADPETWHGKTCHDPADPQEGRHTQAKIFSNQNVPLVRSFAHGEMIYKMVDMGDVTVPTEGAAGAVAIIQQELVGLIDAGPVETDARLRELKTEHKIGIGAMRTQLLQMRRLAATGDDEGDLAHALSVEVLKVDFADGRHLMFLQDDRFWQYDGRVWKRLSDKQAGGFVTRRAEQMIAARSLDIGGAALARVVADATFLMRGSVGRLDDPLRLQEPPANVLSLTNCEFDLDTWDTRPHTPESHLRIAQNVTYDPQATAPTFERVMCEIMGGDAEMYRHLCEIIAFIVSPRKIFAGFVLLAGGGSNGKTLVLETLDLLMGESIRHCDISTVNHNNFASNALLGKSAVLDDDLDFDTELPVANIKKISESKMVGGEVKNGEHFNFRCEVTPVMASNGFPPTRDLTFGFVRRMNVLKFEQRYLIRSKAEEYLRETHPGITVDDAVAEGLIQLADETLRGVFHSEASGILNIILLAMQRLRARRSFLEPQQAVDARNEWREAADSVMRFLHTSHGMIADQNSSIRMSDFKQYYFNWCQMQGIRPKGERNIKSSLEGSGLRVTRTNGADYLRGYRFEYVVAVDI